MKPSWFAATSSTGILVLVGTTIERAAAVSSGFVSGMYLVAWPVVLVGTVELHARMRTLPKATLHPALGARSTYLTHLLLGLAAIPLTSALIALLLSDLPRLAGPDPALASTALLSGYYRGFVGPLLARASDGESGIVICLAKWAVAAVLVPVVLEWSRRTAARATFRLGDFVAPEDAVQGAPVEAAAEARRSCSSWGCAWRRVSLPMPSSPVTSSTPASTSSPGSTVTSIQRESVPPTMRSLRTCLTNRPAHETLNPRPRSLRRRPTCTSR
jgi:hypothetical protein